VLLPDPGAARLAGVKEAVKPDGSALVENATAELKPPETATVSVTELLEPGATDTEPALSLNCKDGVGTLASLQ
jgi:hypothetical protein